MSQHKPQPPSRPIRPATAGAQGTAPVSKPVPVAATRPTPLATPQQPRPVAAATPQPKPVAVAPPRPVAVAPPQPQHPADDLAQMFEQPNVSTKGVPVEQAMQQGLRGSQVYGSPPPATGEETEFASPEAIDYFAEGDAESRGQANLEDPDGGEGEDDHDDAPLSEDREEEEMQAAAILPPAQRPVLRPTPAPSTPTVQGQTRKAYQRIQPNGTFVVDPRLAASLASYPEALAYLTTLESMEYSQFNEGQAYTGYMALSIVATELGTRVGVARAVLIGDDEGLPEEAIVIVGKGAPQTPQQGELGRSEGDDLGAMFPETPVTPPNPMMDKCRNIAVGCTSPRMNHMQGSGKCFKPDCPCQGRCQKFVGTALPKSEGQADAISKSADTSKPIHSQAAARQPGSTSGGDDRGTKIGAPGGSLVGNRPTAGSGRPQPAIRQPAAPVAAGAGGRPGQPVPVRPATGQTQAGGQVPVSVPSSAGTRPSDPGRESAGEAPQSGGAPDRQQQGQQQQAGEAQLPGNGKARDATPETGSDENREAIITADRLDSMIRVGGSGPEHSSYWPAMDEDGSDIAEARREFIITKVINFYDRAIHEEKELGAGKTRVIRDELKLDSTSYRVVLAANELAYQMEMYASAPSREGYDEGNDKALENEVGKAARAYVDAHISLPANQIDCNWAEYQEYLTVFNVEMGTLLHTIDQQQQTQ